MDLFIIDAIGPFFRGYQRDVFNWSKIPFHHFEDKDGLRHKRFKKAYRDFKTFIDSVSEMGYNAISIDDLPHLVSFEFYPTHLEALIQQYRDHYRNVFDYARSRGMKIFLNTDVLFHNVWISRFARGRFSKSLKLLEIACETVFRDFDVDGIIFRIGESDGVDVKGEFNSQLMLKTPRQANRMLRHLLPLFERHNKYLIFRTWSVGIYPIGDLMWNEKTFDRVFADMDSGHLIISMKFGDTDFFDNLSLNPLFFRGTHKKILELQARREREGFGLLPYYVGWQYESYLRELIDREAIVGVSVWCQTGGWSGWKHRTFLKNSSPWNELNTFAIIQMARYARSAEEALTTWFQDEAIVQFTRDASRLVHYIFYISPFAQQQLYFRRLRIPPLVWIFWDHVSLTPLMIALFEYHGKDKFKIPKRELRDLLKRGRKLKIDNIEFIHDSLLALAFCRRSLWKRSIKLKHMEFIRQYAQTYDKPFKISIHISAMNYSKVRTLFALFLRNRPQYRFIDRVMLNPLVAILFRVLYRMMSKNLPAFANKQAMRVDMLFK